MRDHPPIEPNPLSHLGDIDLYCLDCGYNLRGLSGDPRRCPECGNLNPIGDLEVPAPFITAQLQRMETAPAVCLSAALLACVFLAAVIVSLLLDLGPLRGSLSGCATIPLLISAIVWTVGVFDFRRSCLGKPGWKQALWKYHVYGLLLCVLVGGGPPAGLTVGSWIGGVLRTGDRARDRHIQTALAIGACIGWVVLIVIAARWGYRRAKEDMEPLQREVAVSLARERLRRTLRTRHREGIFGSVKPRL